MRSRGSAALLLALVVFMSGVGRLLAQPATAAAPSMDAAATTDAAAIKAAVDALRADPNLGPERTIKSLVWTGPRQQPQANPQLPGWLQWLSNAAAWVDQSARVLVWIVVGFAAVLLIVWLARLAQGRDAMSAEDHFVAPTHVRELDIRPEALPADIGAAARALWDAGDQRAALALLYRGLLSRLVHSHRVPIKASSTEGDCLALASERLSMTALDFASRLVRTWQQAVWGHQAVQTSVVHQLCDEFAVALAAPADPGAEAA